MGARGVSEKRTLLLPPPKYHTLGFSLGPLRAAADGLALCRVSQWTLSQPLLRDRRLLACWDILGCWVHEGARKVGTTHRSSPLTWGEGSLFSVPAVFLLFNLNTQLLHRSCIRGRGCCMAAGAWEGHGQPPLLHALGSSPSSVWVAPAPPTTPQVERGSCT